MLALVLSASTHPSFDVLTTAHWLVGGRPQCFVLAQTPFFLEVWNKGPVTSRMTTLQTMLQVMPGHTKTRVVLHFEQNLEVSVVSGTASVDQLGRGLDLPCCLLP
jgi:hypothetical protein